MEYQAKNFDHLLGGLTGFSDESLQNHFKLYAGYVANTNKVAEKLKTLDKGSPEYAELKRRFGWEFNGMRLHEYHFEAMTKNFAPLAEDSPLYKKIVEDFGSFENWTEGFKATAKMRGIGWAITYFDKRENRIFNTWVGEHDAGHLAGATPLLNLDVFEHAFMIDYQMDRASYIDAFMQIIDWTKVTERFK